LIRGERAWTIARAGPAPFRDAGPDPISISYRTHLSQTLPAPAKARPPAEAGVPDIPALRELRGQVRSAVAGRGFWRWVRALRNSTKSSASDEIVSRKLNLKFVDLPFKLDCKVVMPLYLVPRYEPTVRYGASALTPKAALQC
jgi:hypothetical protein